MSSSKKSHEWGNVLIQAGKTATNAGTVLTISFVGQDSIEVCTALFDRALNCWEDAPPELKALGDRIKFGTTLQTYGLMNGNH